MGCNRSADTETKGGFTMKINTLPVGVSPVNAAVTSRARIDEAWETNALRTDWSGLEDVLRLILVCYREGLLNPYEALARTDEAVAAFTKRGYELL